MEKKKKTVYCICPSLLQTDLNLHCPFRANLFHLFLELNPFNTAIAIRFTFSPLCGSMMFMTLKFAHKLLVTVGITETLRDRSTDA